MGFKMGIVGLPNVGKSTLFNALTRTAAAQAANFPFCTIEPNVGEVAVPKQRMAILADTPGADGVSLTAGPEGARAILVAGRPLREPIAQYGPFVMNTQDEIYRAVEDYRAGRLA